MRLGSATARISAFLALGRSDPLSCVGGGCSSSGLLLGWSAAAWDTAPPDVVRAGVAWCFVGVTGGCELGRSASSDRRCRQGGPRSRWTAGLFGGCSDGLRMFRSVFPRRFRGWLLEGDRIEYRSARFGTWSAILCGRGRTTGDLLLCFALVLFVSVCFVLFLYVFSFLVLVRIVLYTFCPLRLYALGIFGFCPFWCSCVTGKGVSQFLRRSVDALALCIARATSTVPDRRLGPVDVPEPSVVLLIVHF